MHPGKVLVLNLQSSLTVLTFYKPHGDWGGVFESCNVIHSKIWLGPKQGFWVMKCCWGIHRGSWILKCDLVQNVSQRPKWGFWLMIRGARWIFSGTICNSGTKLEFWIIKRGVTKCWMDQNHKLFHKSNNLIVIKFYTSCQMLLICYYELRDIMTWINLTDGMWIIICTHFSNKCRQNEVIS